MLIDISFSLLGTLIVYRNDRIRGTQAELGLTAEEVAMKAGVNVNTVSAIRNGKSVRTDSLEKVINALGLNPIDVFTPKVEESAEAVGM